MSKKDMKDDKAPHIKDVEDLKAIVKAKNPASIEELHKIIEGEADNIPNLTKRIKEMILVRGSIIDMAINIETVYNEIILLTEAPGKIKDIFQKKTDFIKEIMEALGSQKEHFSKELFEKMDRLVTIRNLYAHVPQEYFSGDFRFNGGDHYYNKKTEDLKERPIKEINTEFVNLCILMQQKLGECLKLITKEVENQKSYVD